MQERIECLPLWTDLRPFDATLLAYLHHQQPREAYAQKEVYSGLLLYPLLSTILPELELPPRWQTRQHLQ